jgi:hypothetical protein
LGDGAPATSENLLYEILIDLGHNIFSAAGSQPSRLEQVDAIRRKA